MRRRYFIAGLGGALFSCTVASAEENGTRRVGVFGGHRDDAQMTRAMTVFSETIRKLGWIEGQNLQIDYYEASSDDMAKKRAGAAELLGRRPDAILAVGVNVLPLASLTETVPIVFTQFTDPVGRGLVASLAHPGRNVTGFSYFDATIGGKWLALLKQLVPGLSRVAVMFNDEVAPQAPFYVTSVRAAAGHLGIDISIAVVHTDVDIENAVRSLGRAPDEGLVVVQDSFTISHRDVIIRAAESCRVPAIYPFRDFARDGGLIAYDVDLDEQYRGAATYLDRILKGASPAELPVQEPTRFELVINLKTAKAMGLTVPDLLLTGADEVIE